MLTTLACSALFLIPFTKYVKLGFGVGPTLAKVAISLGVITIPLYFTFEKSRAEMNAVKKRVYEENRGNLRLFELTGDVGRIV